MDYFLLSEFLIKKFKFHDFENQYYRHILETSKKVWDNFQELCQIFTNQIVNDINKMKTGYNFS